MCNRYETPTQIAVERYWHLGPENAPEMWPRGLTGVAIMLGMLNGFAWSLVIVPGVAWLICAIGVAVAVQPGVAAGVREMKHQLDADRSALKAAGDSHGG
jgi:hypothetical protein